MNAVAVAQTCSAILTGFPATLPETERNRLSQNPKIPRVFGMATWIPQTLVMKLPYLTRNLKPEADLQPNDYSFGFT